jgi:predicted nucleic acid-binding protein
MGSNPWVVNASPLIPLDKNRHLDLLAALADTVVIPQAVAREVGAKPDGGAILAELSEGEKRGERGEVQFLPCQTI